jgi:23S rRNA (guanosine2251-2'-O)-methyltransferase
MSGSQKRLGNHNRDWVWGRNVVLSTLEAGRWRPFQVWVSTRLDQPTRSRVQQLARAADIPLSDVNDDQLSRQCRQESHQGLAAQMPEFPYAPLSELLSEPLNPSQVWLLLDRLQDSFNFGAMVRSAHAFGLAGVILGSRDQCPVNSQVVRSSAGAVNFLPIYRVTELAEAAMQLKQHGAQLMAATEHAETSLWTADWTGPCGLVLGNEGVGISREVLRQCDAAVRIPIQPGVGSLNAAVAAGVFCAEWARRQALLGTVSP